MLDVEEELEDIYGAPTPERMFLRCFAYFDIYAALRIKSTDPKIVRELPFDVKVALVEFKTRKGL